MLLRWTYLVYWPTHNKNKEEENALVKPFTVIRIWNIWLLIITSEVLLDKTLEVRFLAKNRLKFTPILTGFIFENVTSCHSVTFPRLCTCKNPYFVSSLANLWKIQCVCSRAKCGLVSVGNFRNKPKLKMQKPLDLFLLLYAHMPRSQ